MFPEREDNLNQPILERGVYTLANDAVIEWFQAFIRNFRQTTPTLPLTVIPYDKSIFKIKSLTEQFNFTIMDTSECAHFDVLEDVVMGQGKSAAMFRKWACFFGRYAQFIFLDSDVIITFSLEEILGAFNASDYDLVYFDTDITVVYRPEAVPEMITRFGSAGFIAGAFVSRTGIIDYKELVEISQQAAQARSKMVIDQVDQPFLNYVFDTSRRRITHIARLFPQFSPSTWARQAFAYYGKTNSAVDIAGKLMPFIHWAGCAYPVMVRPEIYLKYRTMGQPLPARIGYRILFYFRRYRIFISNAIVHWKKVATQCLTDKAWRKFYLCRLIGIKVKVPVLR